MLKSLKKNQIIIYVIALMLVAAGYFNYTTGDKSIQTSANPEITYKENLAEIGDATLVNSNEVDVTEDSLVANAENENTVNTVNEETTEQVQQTNANADDYFSKSKLDRDTMYSQMLETYQNIVNSTTVSEEQRSIATQEITNINNTKNAIMICENLLKTKGFENNLVFVNKDNVSIVVKVNDEISVDQVAQIQNIISREMNVEVENIHITQKE